MPLAAPPIPQATKNQAFAFLNQLYRNVWKTIHPSDPLKMQRDQLARQRRLIDAHGEYSSELAYHLVGSSFEDLSKEGAFAYTAENAKRAVVLYRKAHILPSQVLGLMTQTTVRTTNGDLDLLLPSGDTQLTAANYKDYLTDEQRRIKRDGMVIVAPITVTAKGGFNSPRERLAQPISVNVICMAAPQFEKYQMPHGQLEVSDFIVQKGAPANPRPLFPEYYPNNVIPSYDELQKKWTEIEKEMQMLKARGEEKSAISLIMHEDDPRSIDAPFVRLRNGEFFLRQSYQRALTLVTENLIVPALNQAIDLSKPKYLKATAGGTGFFSSVGLEDRFKTSLKKFGYDAWVKTFVQLIEQGRFKPGTAIEFLFYKMSRIPPALIAAAEKHDIDLIWQENRDLSDFSTVSTVSTKTPRVIDSAQYERYFLNPGDVFSLIGNEPKPDSVEAALANNSDLREVLNWHFNHYLLDPSHHIGV